MSIWENGNTIIITVNLSFNFHFVILKGRLNLFIIFVYVYYFRMYHKFTKGIFHEYESMEIQL